MDSWSPLNSGSSRVRHTSHSICTNIHKQEVACSVTHGAAQLASGFWLQPHRPILLPEWQSWSPMRLEIVRSAAGTRVLFHFWAIHCFSSLPSEQKLHSFLHHIPMNSMSCLFDMHTNYSFKAEIVETWFSWPWFFNLVDCSETVTKMDESIRSLLRKNSRVFQEGIYGTSYIQVLEKLRARARQCGPEGGTSSSTPEGGVSAEPKCK